MKPKKNKTKSLFKKLLKLFLWTNAVILVLLVIIFLFIRIKYPAEEIIKIAELQASKALNNRVVEIGEASLNPLKGLDLNQLIFMKLHHEILLKLTALNYYQLKKYLSTTN